MKKCPYCAEEIQDEAIKCKYCGEWINNKKIQTISKSSDFKSNKTMLKQELKKQKKNMEIGIFLEYFGCLGVILGNLNIIPKNFLYTSFAIVEVVGVVDIISVLRHSSSPGDRRGVFEVLAHCSLTTLLRTQMVQSLGADQNLWDWLNAPFHPKSQSPLGEPLLALSFG